MKRMVFVLALVIAGGIASSHASLYRVELSPGPGQALNLGATTYTQDHAVGLAGLNEEALIVLAGSGNTVGDGITYDSATRLLTFDFAYGSAFGFTDLVGELTVLHFHGPDAVNYPLANSSAGVILDLAPFHTASGTGSGRITGSTTLSELNETRLLDNQIYVNIHSSVYGSGEIRGQLVLVPEPSSVLLALIGGASICAIRRRTRPSGDSVMGTHA